MDRSGFQDAFVDISLEYVRYIQLAKKMRQDKLFLPEYTQQFSSMGRKLSEQAGAFTPLPQFYYFLFRKSTL